KPLEDLHRRRLAGTVGPEQPVALAGGNLEVEAGDGDDVRVAFDQAAAEEDGRGHGGTGAQSTRQTTCGSRPRPARAGGEPAGRRLEPAPGPARKPRNPIDLPAPPGRLRPGDPGPACTRSRA